MSDSDAIMASLEREDAYYRAHMNEPNDLGGCGAEGHVDGCPGKAGGDHEYDHEHEWEVNYPSQECLVCGLVEDAPEPFYDHEGDPAFNGAFDRW